MTTKPQGVAQRVLEHLLTSRDTREYESPMWGRVDGEHSGAEYMLDCLSTEARAIIHRHTHEVYSEPEAVVGMRVLAKRLGLAIDHDETEGE